MYNMDNVLRDFPWAAVPSQGSPVEPWRDSGSIEDALYALWSDPLSEPVRDEAARLLAVGPYDPIEDGTP